MMQANPCRVKGAGHKQTPERPVAMPDEVLKVVAAIEPRYQPMCSWGRGARFVSGSWPGCVRTRVNLLHRTIRVEENAVELSSGRTIFGPPKTDAGRRTVAVPPELVPALETHLAEYVGPEPDALVFTSPEGHPLRRTKFRLRWVVACEAAGISGLHFHDLRGSGATWAAHAGATLAELMNRLGHASPNMAMRYQHATEERGPRYRREARRPHARTGRAIGSSRAGALRIEDSMLTQKGAPLRHHGGKWFSSQQAIIVRVVSLRTGKPATTTRPQPGRTAGSHRGATDGGEYGHVPTTWAGRPGSRVRAIASARVGIMAVMSEPVAILGAAYAVGSHTSG